MENKEIARQKLIEIVELTKQPGDGVLATCRRVALDLANQARPSSHWSGSYIHQVMSGKLPASKRLSRSINGLYSKLSERTEEFEHVVILAPVGIVAPNSMVVVRSQKCAFRDCGRMFIPSNPSQKFCNEKCRKAKRRIKNAS